MNQGHKGKGILETANLKVTNGNIVIKVQAAENISIALLIVSRNNFGKVGTSEKVQHLKVIHPVSCIKHRLDTGCLRLMHRDDPER